MDRPRLLHLLRFTVIATVAAGSFAGAVAQTPSETTPPAAPPATTPAPGGSAPATANPPPAPAAAAPAQTAPPATTPAPPPAADNAPTAPPPAAQAPAATPPAAATSAPTPAPVQTADPFGEEITLAPKTVLIVKGKADWDNAFDSLMEALKSATATLDKQGIARAGNPMIVYTSTDDNGFTFQAEIPVAQPPKNLGKSMSMGLSPDGKALKFVHRGSYDNMDNTYEAITNHLDVKAIEAKDTFVEEYLTDPLKTAEDKLVINVYVPMK
jgi:effector-binding domain-containing protein